MSDVALGMDVGGTKILALLVQRDGTVIAEQKTSTPHTDLDDQGQTIATEMAALARSIIEGAGYKASEVPIGFGMPGLVKRDGTLSYAPNLQSANGVNLTTSLGAALNNPNVFGNNDGNLAAMAEHEWGSAKGEDDFIMVTLGTGIGGGVFTNGKLVQGRSGFAGEIGHMVVEANGVQCTCGGKGCWERYASGGGLQRIVQEALGDGRLPTLAASGREIRAEDVTAAAAEGLAEAIALMESVGWWLALGIANLAAILDTSYFVIGGGLSAAAPLILPAAREALSGLVEGYQYRVPIVISESTFGPLAGALGAALLGFENAA